MRPGPPRGDSHELELTVTDDLAASSAPGLPAVASVTAMVAAGEHACQDLVGPHLEAGEVVVVTKQDLSLRAPIPVGATATVTATVALGTPSTVTYEILVRHGGSMVARGSLEHRVVDTAALAAEIAERQPAAAS